ncbi:DNA-binding protein [Haloquadratum phage sp.]|nr:DNA-binding protein [Haloquadratum phage sp.]
MTEDTDQPYQVMPEFDPDEFERLKKGIKEHGIEYPIIVDTDGNIVDGHHRVKAWKELGRDPSDIPRRVVDEPDGEQYHRAYRVNLNRRDVDKEEIVKDYLLEHQTRVKEDSDEDIGLDIGVSQSTVQRARTDLEDDDKFTQVNNFDTDEKKQMVHDYIESNPDASNRDVASAVECDVSYETVRNWRNEWDIDTTEQTSGLDTYVMNESQETEAREFAEKVTSDDVPEDKQNSVKERVDEVNSGKMPVSEANKKTEKEKEIEKDEQRREEQRESFKEAVKDNSALELHHGDFKKVLSDYDDSSIDHIITDPPYDKEALELWEQLATVAADKLKDGGYLIAYSGQSYLPQVYDILSNELNYIWQLTVSHESEGKHPYHSISIGYKPVLLFGKETSGYRGSLVTDTVDIGAREKDEHEWQQSAREASKFVEKFTEPNDVICDPMCGSGTTGIAAIQNDRQAILIDNDAEAIDKTKNRISEVIKK